VGAAEEKNPRKFLAIYPTKFEEALNSQEFSTGVNKESAMFPRQKETHHNGDFDARNYKTIEDYNPNNRGEGKSPGITLLVGQKGLTRSLTEKSTGPKNSYC